VAATSAGPGDEPKVLSQRVSGSAGLITKSDSRKQERENMSRRRTMQNQRLRWLAVVTFYSLATKNPRFSHE
jgi:hypothetical protein